MTDDQMATIRAEMTTAVQEGIRTGIGHVARAMREGATASASERTTVSVRQPKQHNPLAIAAMVVGMVVPFGGLVGWGNSLASRVSILEAKQAPLEAAAVELSALKQELSDFRGEFRDWKRENQRHEAEAGK